MHTGLAWQKGKRTIISGGRYQITSDKMQLTIHQLSTVDNGEFRCVAKNALGVGTHSVGYLVTVVCKYL